MTKDSQDWLDDPLKEILMKHKAWVASGFAPLVDNGLEVYSDSQAEQAIKAHIKQEMLALVGEDGERFTRDKRVDTNRLWDLANGVEPTSVSEFSTWGSSDKAQFRKFALKLRDKVWKSNEESNNDLRAELRKAIEERYE